MQKGFSALWVLVGIILVGGLILFAPIPYRWNLGPSLWQRITTPSIQSIDLSQAQTSPAPSPADETADWYTYTTNKFSFRYPPGFTVEEKVVDFIIFKHPGAMEPYEGSILVDARMTGIYADFDQAFDRLKEVLENIQVTYITNGVMITGNLRSSINPHGFSFPKAVALLRYKQGAISAEYYSDPNIQPDRITPSLFEKFLSHFTFIGSGFLHL